MKRRRNKGIKAPSIIDDKDLSTITRTVGNKPWLDSLNDLQRQSVYYNIMIAEGYRARFLDTTGTE